MSFTFQRRFGDKKFLLFNVLIQCLKFLPTFWFWIPWTIVKDASFIRCFLLCLGRIITGLRRWRWFGFMLGFGGSLTTLCIIFLLFIMGFLLNFRGMGQKRLIFRVWKGIGIFFLPLLALLLDSIISWISSPICTLVELGSHLLSPPESHSNKLHY